MATTAFVASAEIGGCSVTTRQVGAAWYLTVMQAGGERHALFEATTREDAERNHLSVLALLSERRINDPMGWAETVALERIGPGIPILAGGEGE